MNKKQSVEELRRVFEAKLAIKRPGVRLVDKYVNANTRTEFECEQGHKWVAFPSAILQRSGCPHCYRLAAYKTHKQFEEEMAVIHPTIRVIGKYVNDKTKIEVECLECTRKWSATPSSMLQGGGCKICSVKKSLQIKKDRAFEQIKNDPHVQKHFDILSDYKGLTVPMQFRCKYDKFEFERQPASIKKGRLTCPVCGSGGKRSPQSQVTKGLNDLWTTHPHIAQLLLNPDDGYKYAAHNSVKLDFKCPDCGKVAKRLLSYVSQTMPYCQFCGEKRSYPERLMSAVLRSAGVNFETQKRFHWCKFEIDGRQRIGIYDFYFEIDGNKYLIEVQGDQHVNESKFTRLSIDEIWKIDIAKEEIAKENGYIPIVLICQVSDLESIKYEIESSELSGIIDLSKVDWLKCQLETISSPMMQAAELWNNGMRSTMQIAQYLGMSRSPIRRYLLKCAEQGLCDYTPDEGRENQVVNSKKAISKRVVLVNTGEVFESMTEAGRKYGAIGDKIGMVCSGKRLYAGKLDGTPLIWRFEDDVVGKDLDVVLKEGMMEVARSVKRNREGLLKSLMARHNTRRLQNTG